MKLSLFNIVLLFLFPFALFSQSSSEKLLEMKNSFNLGIEEKGLEIASELMSRNEYKDVREETVFFVAEYHFVNSLLKPDLDDKVKDANIAFTYYIVYKNDYPDSKYSSMVDKRITSLNSTVSQIVILRNLFDYYFTEASIVVNSIEFTNKLFTINSPYPYSFFFEGDNETKAIQILERYYDEIIINHPGFEIYGYYWKIISNLSKIKGIDYFSDGIMKFNEKKIFFRREDSAHRVELSDDITDLKAKLYGWLDYLNLKYPHHSLTLNLNLVFAKIFMYQEGDMFDVETKKHIEFVVQNELDKTHPRYMLAKEFLLNNKFK